MIYRALGAESPDEVGHLHVRVLIARFYDFFIARTADSMYEACVPFRVRNYGRLPAAVGGLCGSGRVNYQFTG